MVYKKVMRDDMILTRNASNKYEIAETKPGEHPGKFYASVDELLEGIVALHLTAVIPRPPTCK